MIYSCCDELRRSVVRQKAGWNGIDFLEVIDRAATNEADRQRFLTVHFVKELGTLALDPKNIRIEGGERIQNIKVLSTSSGIGADANVLMVEVDQPGDFSIYQLRLVKDTLDESVPESVDPQLAAVEFSFKVECPSPFDCAPRHVCPAEQVTLPEIDYLAKDYASFRRLMLDRMAALMPAWKERNAADLGIVLVEALAEHAGRAQHAARLGRQPEQAELRRGQHRVRHLAHGLASGHVAHDLLEQERVAPGDIHQRGATQAGLDIGQLHRFGIDGADLRQILYLSAQLPIFSIHLHRAPVCRIKYHRVDSVLLAQSPGFNDLLVRKIMF